MYDTEEMMPLAELDEHIHEGSGLFFSTMFEQIAQEAGAEFVQNALIELRFNPNND